MRSVSVEIAVMKFKKDTWCIWCEILNAPGCCSNLVASAHWKFYMSIKKGVNWDF